MRPAQRGALGDPLGSAGSGQPVVREHAVKPRGFQYFHKEMNQAEFYANCRFYANQIRNNSLKSLTFINLQ
jgi:hypothetical protein